MIRSKSLAETLAQEGESFIIGLSRALIEAKAVCAPEEYERFKHAIGMVIGTLEVKLMWPLYKLHPELEPGNLRNWRNEP